MFKCAFAGRVTQKDRPPKLPALAPCRCTPGRARHHVGTPAQDAFLSLAAHMIPLPNAVKDLQPLSLEQSPPASQPPPQDVRMRQGGQAHPRKRLPQLLAPWFAISSTAPTACCHCLLLAALDAASPVCPSPPPPPPLLHLCTQIGMLTQPPDTPACPTGACLLSSFEIGRAGRQAMAQRLAN